MADDFAAVQEEFERVADDYNNVQALTNVTDAEVERLATGFETSKLNLEQARDRMIEAARSQVLKPAE